MMKIMVILTSVNKSEAIETWKDRSEDDFITKEFKLNGNSYLIVFNGYKIYDGMCCNENKKFDEEINCLSEFICKNLNNNRNNTEFLFLIHNNPKRLLPLIESRIKTKFPHPKICDSHPFEENGLIPSLANAIKTNNNTESVDKFNKLWDAGIKCTKEAKAKNLLHHLLPLDIDMQAMCKLLELLEKDKTDVAVKYLKQMCEESKMYHQGISDEWNNKLNELKSHFHSGDEEITKIEKLYKERITEIEDLYKEKIKPLIEDIKNLISNDINRNIFNKNISNIKGFHAAYKELADKLIKLIEL